MYFNERLELFNLIYKRILFFTSYTYDKHDNEDYWIF